MRLGAFTTILALCIAMLATPARAFLDSDDSSLSAAKIFIAPKHEKITTFSAHSVHEYSVMRGVIRAYVSTEGKVFAYTGHHQMGHPPSVLLGPYLKEYQDAVKLARKQPGRKPLRITTEHIQAGISGPQGALSWYIYLRKLPAGVTRDDIH